MTSAAEERYRIVLGRADPARRDRIAAEFSRIFGVHESMGEQIAAAAPIVVLAGLARMQAMEVVQALVPLRKAGADLRIDISDDRSISQVAWPTPPKIAGRDLADYLICS